MKRFTVISFILLVVLLSACATSGSSGGQSSSNASLVVSGGDTSKTYTRADLEALPSSQSIFNDVSYVGVSVSSLLKDAGFNLNEIKAVKALASDGYSVNYDPSQVFAAEVIVAYAQADGELSADDGAFRMVLPGAEGKLNVRMLTELQVFK
jgi:hypothetical protein